ncbi:uncharacterized protein LOC141607037 isoform X2 [Silene latifolia]|uniref:uncharacterized protein LOC141607037 isoform X2 n=1 Tax=Silene latifolia TaxID=37657 RepID=UPI003D778520
MGKNPSEYTILVITTICMAITMSLNFNEVDASDPPPLQDFCVGIEDPKSAVFVNGLICKNPKKYNLKKSKARAIAAFGSQHPGRVNSAQGLFGTKPAILDDVLTKAYQVDDEVIQKLRAQFSRSLNNEVHIGRSGNNFVKDV